MTDLIANGESGASVRAKLNKMAEALPRNRNIAVFGDSISAQNTGTTSFNSKGYLVQALGLAKQRLSFSVALNFGVAGEKTYEILARISSVLAADPGSCVVLAGTNNLGLVTTETSDAIYAQAISDLASIYDQLTAARIVVYAIPLLPRGNWGALTSPQITQAIAISLRLNAWIREQARTRPPELFKVVPSDQAMCNASTSAYTAIAGATSDNQHPIGYGAFLLAQPLAARINQDIEALPTGPYSLADVRSTDNPFGDIAVGGMMTGTGGVASTGVTGSIASGWTAVRSTGSTLAVAASKETDALTSKSTQVLAFTSSGGGAASEAMNFAQTINAGASTFAAGERLVAEVEFDNVGLGNVLGISCYAQENDGATTIDYHAFAYSGSSLDREPADCERAFVSPEFTVRPYAGSGTQRIVLYFFVYVKCDSGTVAGSIKIKRFNLRKVA